MVIISSVVADLIRELISSNVQKRLQENFRERSLVPKAECDIEKRMELISDLLSMEYNLLISMNERIGVFMNIKGMPSWSFKDLYCPDIIDVKRSLIILLETDKKISYDKKAFLYYSQNGLYNMFMDYDEYEKEHENYEEFTALLEKIDEKQLKSNINAIESLNKMINDRLMDVKEIAGNCEEWTRLNENDKDIIEKTMLLVYLSYNFCMKTDMGVLSEKRKDMVKGAINIMKAIAE